jgi:hypothetical protein
MLPIMQWPIVQWPIWRGSRLRRYGLAGAVTLAVVLVGAVVAVMVSDDPVLDPEDVFPEAVIVSGDRRPEIVFPERVRTFDLSLNRFVDRFVRVCMQGKYSDFRLMLSSRAGDPIVASRFESMFNALKQVRILAIDQAPDIPGLEGPVYVMLVEYDLEPSAVRRGEQSERRRLAILKENGEWRIGPIPHEVVARLQGLEQPATQSAAQPPATAAPATASGPAPPEPPKTMANSPARIEP